MRFQVFLFLAIAGSINAGVPRFVVDNSDPELSDFSRQAVAVCEQWYSKIAEILYGGNPPDVPAEVRIRFDSTKVPAYAEGTTIELVHILQRYPVPPRCDSFRIVGCFVAGRHYAPTWLGEGIADYITYTFYTGTNKPFLQINSDGVLFGYDESLPYLYGLQRSKTPVNAAFPPRGIPAKKGYQHGYTVSSSFLLWLEKHKDPQIIRKLNLAIRNGRYRPSIWREHCRASVDQLWDEFLRYSSVTSAKRTARERDLRQWRIDGAVLCAHCRNPSSNS